MVVLWLLLTSVVGGGSGCRGDRGDGALVIFVVVAVVVWPDCLFM